MYHTAVKRRAEASKASLDSVREEICMTRIFSSILSMAMLTALFAVRVGAQTAESSELKPGTTVRVTLRKPLSSKKSKSGDQVIMKTTESLKSDGHEVVPKGSKIIGHITEAQAHSKENPEATLGIILDHATLKDGAEVPLHLSIQAIAPAEASAEPTMSMTPATAAGSGGGMGPVTGPLTGGPNNPNGGTPNQVASPESPLQSPAGNLTSSGELTPSCRGVLRIEGVALAKEDPKLGSMIVSQNRNIQLDIGTQMMLRVPGN